MSREKIVPTNELCKAAIEAVKLARSLQYSLQDIRSNTSDSESIFTYLFNLSDRVEGENSHGCIGCLTAALFTADCNFRVNEFTFETYEGILALIEKDLDSLKNTKKSNLVVFPGSRV